jgi:hypothetical protein
MNSQIAYLVCRCVPTAALIGYHSLDTSSLCEKQRDDFAIVKRLKSFGLDTTCRRKVFDRDPHAALKTFTVKTKEGLHSFGREGFPIARIGEIEIKGTPKEINETFMDFINRKDWDSTCQDSQNIISKIDGDSVNFFVGKAGVLVPAREFVFQQMNVPSSVVGINDLASICVYLKDANEKQPSKIRWDTVRGRMNALLILQPIGSSKTKVTYIIEVEPNGWARWFLSREVIDFFCGNCTTEMLLSLKADIEKSFDEGLSVEEAARREFQKKLQKEKHFVSIVDDVGVDKQDIKDTLAMLHNKLRELEKTERTEKLDLSALKNRVREDIRKARSRS